MDDAIYKKQYDFELDQHHHLASRVNIPLMAITVLGGALCTMAVKFQYGDGILTIIFLLLTICSFMSLIVSVYYLFRSLLGYIYQKIPSFSEIEKMRSELIRWYLNNGGTEVEADEEIRKSLLNSFSIAADHNGINNINRASYLYKSTLSLSYSVVLLAVCGMLFVFDATQKQDLVHQVNIIGEVLVKEKIK